MLVNIPTYMPDLDRAKIRRYAVINRILVDFDNQEDGKNGFFSAHDNAQGDFKRLSARCNGMSEIELYNAISEQDDENTEQDKKYLDDKWISDKESLGGSAYLLWMWKLCEKEAWQKATDNKGVEWMLNSVNYDVMRNED